MALQKFIQWFICVCQNECFKSELPQFCIHVPLNGLFCKSFLCLFFRRKFLTFSHFTFPFSPAALVYGESSSSTVSLLLHERWTTNFFHFFCYSSVYLQCISRRASLLLLWSRMGLMLRFQTSPVTWILRVGAYGVADAFTFLATKHRIVYFVYFVDVFYRFRFVFYVSCVGKIDVIPW